MARLKKELDTVLTLQGDLDAVEKAIHAAKITLSQSSTPSKPTKILRGLEEMHDQLSDRVEELYVSLNIQHQENVPFVFGVFVSRKVSLVTLALGNLSLSVSGFGKASSALNFYL